jgi:hypothetical protein
MEETVKLNVTSSEKNMILEVLYITQDIDNFQKFKKEMHNGLEKYANWIKNKKEVFA